MLSRPSSARGVRPAVPRKQLSMKTVPIVRAAPEASAVETASAASAPAPPPPPVAEGMRHKLERPSSARSFFARRSSSFSRSSRGSQARSSNAIVLSCIALRGSKQLAALQELSAHVCAQVRAPPNARARTPARLTTPANQRSRAWRAIVPVSGAPRPPRPPPHTRTHAHSPCPVIFQDSPCLRPRGRRPLAPVLSAHRPPRPAGRGLGGGARGLHPVRRAAAAAPRPLLAPRR